jgi:hypothetical protein
MGVSAQLAGSQLESATNSFATVQDDIELNSQKRFYALQKAPLRAQP